MLNQLLLAFAASMSAQTSSVAFSCGDSFFRSACNTNSGISGLQPGSDPALHELDLLISRTAGCSVGSGLAWDSPFVIRERSLARTDLFPFPRGRG